MIRILCCALWCVAAVLLTSCAVMDGGVVGTGTRSDCEAKTAPDGTPTPLPEECKRQRTAPR
jgi:hypothetical protein